MKCINCSNEYVPFFGDYFICKKCGLFVNTTYYSKEVLMEKLANNLLSASRDKEIEKIRLSTAKDQICVINEYSKKKGKIYDVAAASGFFMKIAKEDGWEVYGNEISNAAIIWGKENYGLNIDYGYFDDIMHDKNFDAIVFFDALEHQHDPIASLNKAYEMLNDDGLIY